MRTFATALRQPDEPSLAHVDEVVREMFEALLARPVPHHLLALVDRLEARAQLQQA